MIRNRTKNQLESTPIRMPKTRASWIEPPPNTCPDGGTRRYRAAVGFAGLDQTEKGTTWHIESPSSPATAPAPSSRRPPGECSRRPASSSSGTSRTPAIDVYEEEGNPLPDRTLDSIKERRLAIKGPTTTPVGSGFRSINVALRKELDLYACIRPVQGLRGRAHALPRDRHRDRPREHRGPLRGHRVREGLARRSRSCATFLADELGLAASATTSGISIKPISVFGSERIVEAAFEYAEENGRKKVTAAHKANIMKFSDGLFLEVARRGRRDGIRTSSSRTGSSTTSATSSCRGPRSTT